MKVRIFDSQRRDEPKSGYGLITTHIAANLEDLGHEVCFFPRNGDTEDVVLWIRPPSFVSKPEFAESKRNVFYTMHESETFEDKKKMWGALLNMCDAIIVPTEWNKKVFKDNGVTKPITVIPLGVDSQTFHGAKTSRFSILALHDALGSDNSRENWKDTLRAYYQAFANTKAKTLLTIKSYNIKRDQYYLYLHELQEEFKTTLPVDVVEVDMTNQTLNNLYANHWLFVKNANREGWSLPLLEAISCEINVAYTDLPVLKWAKEYKKGKTFPAGDTQALANIFLEGYKEYGRVKNYVNQFAWKKCAIKVEEVLNNV